VTEHLTESERQQTIRWLVQNQDESGGFRGRTGKEADACYCFWCGAALQVCVCVVVPIFFVISANWGVCYYSSGVVIQILGAGDLVNRTALATFLARCQFKYGGIAKAPRENPGSQSFMFPGAGRSSLPLIYYCPRSISHVPVPSGDRDVFSQQVGGRRYKFIVEVRAV
jgi:prenyltransferase beta subunit